MYILCKSERDMPKTKSGCYHFLNLSPLHLTFSSLISHKRFIETNETSI